MLILAGHRITAKHIHKLTVITISLVRGFILEQKMFLHERTVHNNLRLFVRRGVLRSNMRVSTAFFYVLLDLLRNSAASTVALKPTLIDPMP